MKIKLVSFIILLANSLHSVQSQENPYRRERVSWCTISIHEQKKCVEWSRAIEDVNKQAVFGQEPLELNLDCVQASDKDQCMSMIDDERADLIALDPGELDVAGRYHSLSPIMTEKYGPTKSDIGHYSVAIVKKHQAKIQSLADLYGRKACFSGVNHMASWTLPLASIIDLSTFEVTDCNNLVKSASYFFGNSCAPNALINKFNPTGDNPQKMSYLCERRGRVGAHHDPYNGVFATLKCLSDLGPGTGSYGDTVSYENRGGDVAFVRHNTVQLIERLNLPAGLRAEIPSRSDVELLCPQGGRQPVDNWQNCNFGFVPSHAVVVSSRVTPERRVKIQRFLRTSVQLFSGTLTGVASYTTQSPNNIRYDPQIQQQQQQPYDTLVVSPNYGLLRPTDQSLGVAKGTSKFRLTGDDSFVIYPDLDVLFRSDMTDLEPLTGVRQTFKGFMNSFPVQQASSVNSPGNNQYGYQSYVDSSSIQIRSQLDYFEKLRRCPIPAVTLCVTSDKEFSKCQGMGRAFHAASLRPELGCKLASSSLSCMQMVRDRDADLTVLDAADIYIAGKKFNLIPIVSEQIEMHESSYYAIAVARKDDPNTNLFNLKSKRSCHSGFLKAAGWVMPIGVLLSNENMRSYDECDSAHSAAEYFDKACAPGIMSDSITIQKSTSSINYLTIRNMCELCHGSDRSFCSRDASEPFFGDTGAFRCLVEGGGEVAFCKHTTIYENTGGSNRQTWARGLIKGDFELLCRDGSRAPIDQYKSCNLGKVSSNAMVARGTSLPHLVNAYANLFLYGQQYYGSKYSEEYTFKMFVSNDGEDLIFQDATQQISKVPLENQTYTNYLNHELLRALEIVMCT